MLIEVDQYRITLVARNSDNMRRKSAIHIKCLFPRDRMCAHDRMLRARVARLVGNTCVRIKTAIDHLSVVDRCQPLEVGLHSIRQCVVRGIHAGKQRVAAVGRTLLDIEDAAHWRLEIAGHIAVPAFAIRPRAVPVGEDFHQCRFALFVRRGGMDVQLAE